MGHAPALAGMAVVRNPLDSRCVRCSKNSANSAQFSLNTNSRIAPGSPKLRGGGFFPGDVAERCQRTDRAPVAAVAEMHATGMSAREVRKAAGRLGVAGTPKDRAGAIAAPPDAGSGELPARGPSGPDVPHLRLDATHVRRRGDGRAAPAALGESEPDAPACLDLPAPLEAPAGQQPPGAR